VWGCVEVNKISLNITCHPRKINFRSVMAPIIKDKAAVFGRKCEKASSQVKKDFLGCNKHFP
jgi:hypothetical protein